MIGRSAVSALALLLIGCKAETPAPQPPRPVLTMVLQPATSGATRIVGVVEPRYRTDLSFRVLGRLIARPVQVGDLVDADQVVATLDAAALDLGVRSAAAELANAQAQLSNALGTEARQKALVDSDATTRASVDNATQAKAAAEASVTRAQANLAKAREQLGYAQLKTEFAGVVTATGAEPGQTVSPGQSIVTVARPDVREAVIDVSEDAVSALSTGTGFTVALQLDPTITAQGSVREIAPGADAATRTRRVRILLKDPPSGFWLGTTVVASQEDPRRPVLSVPASAVLRENGRNYVWIADAGLGQVSKREVQAGEPVGGQVAVASGIEAGVRIVTAGVHSLQDGQKVRVAQEDQP